MAVGIWIDGRSVDVTIRMSKLTSRNVMRLKILVLCAAAGSNVSMSFGLLQEVTMDSSTQKFKPSQLSGQANATQCVDFLRFSASIALYMYTSS